MPQEPMTATLGRTAAVGPFFTVRTDLGSPRDQGFLPLSELYRGGHQSALRHRLKTVAAQLGTADRGVAASLVYQGLAGRLWSIALAPAAVAGDIPDLDSDALWWHPNRSTPDELWLPAPTSLPSASEQSLACWLQAAVLHDHLVPLHHAISAESRLSSQVLWGNAASALVGTLRVLHDWCRRSSRPEAADRAVALAVCLLEDPHLRDTGTLDPTLPAFSRRSCCLYYRVPGGGLCGDCVLRRTRR
ncbi:(2Fe-2S)-binding protein [Streptomyces lydicus]|uniref:(2Fe-2S)-binding protein n=1 Tax=Streptomyces lydicus TaxID=47763 RepID=UPI002989B611|nr:(2Fe-2S)-binding protein [Streptomyces lydicus]